MQKLEVGDTVQFTASVVLGLQREAPEIFQKLVDTQRTGGKITHVDSESITIDIGGDSPVVVDTDPLNAHMVLQLVQKADAPLQLTEPEQLKQAAAVSQPQPPTMPFPVPFHQLGGQHPMMMFPFAQQPQHHMADTTPPEVRLAQWVMIQFIGLKQYGIVQDLNRGSNEDESSPDKSAWQSNKNLRAVTVELSANEAALYNRAMMRIQSWIGGDQPPVARQPHPETVGADLQTAPTSTDAQQE